jgi:hypothetical protein
VYADYYPFDFADGGQLARLVVGLGDRFAIMVVACRIYFPGMGAFGGFAERQIHLRDIQNYNNGEY